MLHGTVADLRLHRGWCPVGSLSMNGARGSDSHVTEWIAGTVTTTDHITVVGSSLQPINELLFHLRPFDNLDERAAEWERIQPHRRVSGEEQFKWDSEQDESTRQLLASTRAAESEFNEKPPTAAVFFSASDRELGHPDQWWTQCEVLRSIFDALASDVRNGICPTLHVAIGLNPPLTSNYYAPPSEPVTLGLLRHDQHDHGSSRGWLEGMDWTASSLGHA